MFLAAAADYLKFWWHPVVGGVFILAWLIGGTVLVRRVLAGTEALTRSRRTTGYALNLNFVAHGAGLVAMLVVSGFVLVLATRFGRGLVLLAVLLGPAAMIGMTAMVIPFYFPRSTPAPTRRLLLRCTVPLTAAAIILAVGSLIPAYAVRQDRAKLGRCAARLERLYAGVNGYATRYPGRPVPGLQGLAEQGFVSTEDLACPGRPDRGLGYLFAPAPAYGVGADALRIVLWDRQGNHGDDRLAVFANGRMEQAQPAKLDEYFRRPENAQARAVEQADGH